ncbi:MAG TPA: hypothetical protein VEG29_01530 [Candidatus Binatia bacterium]|nr:hypothetical protein [Candidatus Binatia bacterium]
MTWDRGMVMNDDLMDPNADDGAASADLSATDAPHDPAQAARDDAWLAQFRADTAAKVMEYDYEQATESKAALKRDEAERDYDNQMADKLTKDAASARKDEAEDERRAKATPSRHDEFTAQAQTEHHMAAIADSEATRFKEGATKADARVQQDLADVNEHHDQFKKDRADFENLQEQATAAQRIATNEAKLQHPDTSDKPSDKH